MNVPHPGDGPVSDLDLESAVDEFLALNVDGVEEADLLENVHRLIADALEGR